MCSRYTLICDEGFTKRFGITSLPATCTSSFNIAPGRTVPVIVQHETAEAVMMQWGLIPHYAKDTGAIPHPVNARSETLLERSMFRGLLKRNRCLVPATGFYEWKKEGTRKVPYYIHVKNAPCFAFAGLYDCWRDPQGTPLFTYTILTTSANKLVAPVHDRMPVILTQEDEGGWITGDRPSPEAIPEILSPFPSERMEMYPVSPRVNNPSVDDRNLIRPLNTLG